MCCGLICIKTNRFQYDHIIAILQNLPCIKGMWKVFLLLFTHIVFKFSFILGLRPKKTLHRAKSATNWRNTVTCTIILSHSDPEIHFVPRNLHWDKWEGKWTHFSRRYLISLNSKKISFLKSERQDHMNIPDCQLLPNAASLFTQGVLLKAQAPYNQTCPLLLSGCISNLSADPAKCKSNWRMYA